jgi:hypothetical protein
MAQQLRLRCMRRVLIFGFLLGLAPGYLLAQSVKIKDFGIHGYYGTQTPTRVRVLINNPQSVPLSIMVLLRVHSETKPAEPEGRIDSFSQTILLQPREERSLDLPVLIAGVQPAVLDLEARSDAGQVAGERRSLGTPVNDQLVIILCAEDQLCRQAEELLSLSGNANERTGKTRAYTFLPVLDPPEEWWAYSPASTVVLAASPSFLNPEQQTALEGYVRQGGDLLLVESLAGKSAFLSPYRQGKPSDRPQPLGLGRLYRFDALNASLASFFKPPSDGDSPQPRFRFRGDFQDTMSYARKRLALNLTFPGFGWLMMWLLVYILVVGLLNFVLLRRIDRREWGWITTPIIAILFAAVLYFSSSAKRPRSLELDEVAVYVLDEVSPMAAARIGLRVSTPVREDISLSGPEQSLWVGPAGDFAGLAVGDNGISLRRANLEAGQGWHIGLGPPQHIELPMLQWSFRDLDFRGIAQFPGSVRRLAPTQLLNQTGQSFSDAIYVDKDLVYFLGPVAAGATIDLGSARRQSHVDAGIHRDGPCYENQRMPAHPFSLVELACSWTERVAQSSDLSPAFAARFYGLSDQPVPGADLPGKHFVHRNSAITIVSFGRTL